MIRPLALRAAAALALLATPVLAQPQLGDIVSADARWVAHVNVGRIFGAELVQGVMQREGVSLDSGEFSDMKTALGLDPAVDVDTITVYGTAADPERAVAVVSGNVKLEEALDRLVFHMQREEAEVGGLTLHHWHERGSSYSDDDDIYTYVARRVDSDERLLLAAANASDVVNAARVIRGESASLGSSGTSLDVSPSSTAIAYVTASADLLDSVEMDAPDEIVQMLSSLRVEVGEGTGTTYVDANIGLRNETQADQVVAMITGLKAAAELVGTSEPEIRQALPILRSLRVENAGGAVHVRLDVDNDTIFSLMEGHGHGYGDADVRIEKKSDFRKARSEPSSAGSTGWR